MSAPGFLADATDGDVITFRLPTDTTGGYDEFTGVYRPGERLRHAAGFWFRRFHLDGTDRTFNCREDLHITR